MDIWLWEKSDKGSAQTKALRYLMLYIMMQTAKGHIRDGEISIDDVMMGVIPTPDEPTVEPEPDPEPEEPDISSYPNFVQPTGAHDAYKLGDIVNYNGVLYKSKIDNNVWSPDTYPSGWEVYIL